MKITPDVINDLLPIYASGECSTDTRKLVEEYMKENPGIIPPVKDFQHLLPNAIPAGLKANDELHALVKTRRQLRVRSTLMGLAIFFSIVPFSFLYTGGKFYFLMAEAPVSAIVYGALGLLSWGLYFWIRRKNSIL